MARLEKVLIVVLHFLLTDAASSSAEEAKGEMTTDV